MMSAGNEQSGHWGSPTMRDPHFQFDGYAHNPFGENGTGTHSQSPSSIGASHSERRLGPHDHFLPPHMQAYNQMPRNVSKTSLELESAVGSSLAFAISHQDINAQHEAVYAAEGWTEESRGRAHSWAPRAHGQGSGPRDSRSLSAAAPGPGMYSPPPPGLLENMGGSYSAPPLPYYSAHDTCQNNGGVAERDRVYGSIPEDVLHLDDSWSTVLNMPAGPELMPFLTERESRALVLWNVGHMVGKQLRSICDKYGEVYYLRLEFRNKGVALVGYFDLRSAMRARQGLRHDLRAFAAGTGPDGEASAPCANYAVVLNASSSTKEGSLVVRDVPPHVSDAEACGVFQSFGPVRSVGKQTDVPPGQPSGYVVEYFDLRHAKRALQDMSQSKPWGVRTGVEPEVRPESEKMLGCQLLATLARWREEARHLCMSQAFTSQPPAMHDERDRHRSVSTEVVLSGQSSETDDTSPKHTNTSDTPLTSAHTTPASTPGSTPPSGADSTQYVISVEGGHQVISSMPPHQQGHYVARGSGGSKSTTPSNPQYAAQGHPVHMISPASGPHGHMMAHAPTPPGGTGGLHLVGTRNGHPVYQAYHGVYVEVPAGPAYHEEAAGATMSPATALWINRTPPTHPHNGGPGSSMLKQHGPHGVYEYVPYSQAIMSAPPHPEMHPARHIGKSDHERGFAMGSLSAPSPSLGRPGGLDSATPPTGREHHHRGRREWEGGGSEFGLDLRKISKGIDRRTTIMIRNIPNKYTQQMLLAEINANFREAYDFFYLPIDFKNKCNVGYAFVNFIDYRRLVPFIKEFNGQRWKNFNSEKVMRVCAISYARIQGKASMISRFQNSSLMEKDDEYRPLLFYSTGPDKGKPEPMPIGGKAARRGVSMPVGPVTGPALAAALAAGAGSSPPMGAFTAPAASAALGGADAERESGDSGATTPALPAPVVEASVSASATSTVLAAPTDEVAAAATSPAAPFQP